MVQWNDGYVTIKGERFHYLRSVMPKAGARPLVLLHGHSDNGGCWAPVAKHWADVYDVILPDNRGHGKSPRLKPDEVIDNIADHTALLMALGLKGIALGGHSMGAATAASLAGAHPELVSAVILEDPPWWLQRGSRGIDPASRQRTLRHKDATPEQRMAVERKERPTWSEEEIRAWADGKAEYDYSFVDRVVPWGYWSDVAARIRCPGLLVTGDNALGALVPPEVAKQVPTVWKLAQVVHIAGVGHNIRRENPTVFLQAVDAFLSQHYPAS